MPYVVNTPLVGYFGLVAAFVALGPFRRIQGGGALENTRGGTVTKIYGFGRYL